MAKSKHLRSEIHFSKSTLFYFILLAFIVFTLLFNVFPPHHLNTKHRVLGENEQVDDDRKGWTEAISWEPRAFIFHNFLTKAECEHLINISKPHLKKTYVIDPKTGAQIASRARTSYGYFLERDQDAVVSSIENRIANFTFIPKENGESIQILRYEIGQEYMTHQDYFDDPIRIKNRQQRIATILMYLSDVEEGGETVFPRAKGNYSTNRDDLSECARTGIAVKPRMGDALIFWSMKLDGTPDSTSVHGGCPVIKGTKWSATKWLRMRQLKRIPS